MTDSDLAAVQKIIDSLEAQCMILAKVDDEQIRQAEAHMSEAARIMVSLIYHQQEFPL